MISYELPQSSQVTIEIYDITGKLIKTPVNQHQNSGQKEVTWDGNNDSGNMTATGLYFVNNETDYGVTTQKLIMLK